MVKVTLIEANQILSSFDVKLRRYAEGKIKQRSQMKLLRGSVVGMYMGINGSHENVTALMMLLMYSKLYLFSQ